MTVFWSLCMFGSMELWDTVYLCRVLPVYTCPSHCWTGLEEELGDGPDNMLTNLGWV